MTGFEKQGEDFLSALNEALQRGEQEFTRRASHPTRPLVLVVGPPRSGTTVTTQWLSTCGFAVPTNFLARLYRAPYLGGLLQRLLTEPDLNYRDELAVSHGSGFASEAGKTTGLLAPHEFFYFWRQYLPLDVARPMTDVERKSANPQGLAEGLARLEDALERPLAMKAIIAQYDLDLLDPVLPTAIYFHTMRDEVDNVESLLRIRSTVHGSESEWFSVRPRGSDLVEDESPIVQAAAQVAWTNDDLRRQLERLPEHRVLSVEHTHFCRSPRDVYDELATKSRALGTDLGPYVGPASFDENKRQSTRAEAIQEALDHVRRIERGATR